MHPRTKSVWHNGMHPRTKSPPCFMAEFGVGDDWDGSITGSGVGIFCASQLSIWLVSGDVVDLV